MIFRIRPCLFAASTSVLLTPLIAGCGEETPVANVPKPVAPAEPTKLDARALPNVKFVDITKESGITFTHTNGMSGEKLLPETMGSGCAFFDYDGDGDQDLFFVNSCGWSDKDGAKQPTQALFQNDGKGHFADVTKQAGLDHCFFGMGAAVGDYDGDGDLDLYVTAMGGGRLFRNDGGKFADVTAEANARGPENWPSSAAFFDMDNDGDLDLFICNYVSWSADYDRAQSFQLSGKGRAFGPPTAFKGSLCCLMRNDGGKFRDVSEESGVHVKTPELKDPVGKALGVAPCDIDGDGKVDLVVANDTVQNFFFHNLGGGKFEEIAIISGVAYDQAGSARGAMGIDVGDFRNDGSLGVAVANFANEMIALYVVDEPAALRFSDMAPSFGLGAATQPPLKFGLFFFDYDLDGRLDLISVNGHLESDISLVQASESYEQEAQLFWNTGRKGKDLFKLVGEESIGPDLLRKAVGRGSAYADIDGDGDLDIALTVNGGPARLLRNDGGNQNHWVRVVLKGRGANRFAFGAKVALSSGGVTQRRQLFPAKGYLSSVELPCTFGLGKNERVESIAIVWPSGKTSKIENPGIDKTLTIAEPE